MTLEINKLSLEKKEKKQSKEIQKVFHRKDGKTLKHTTNTMDIFPERWKDII